MSQIIDNFRYGVGLLLLPSHLEYPSALRTIPDPSPFLFVRGSLAETKNNGIGIVGSRHATAYGRGIAERFGLELSSQGVTVIDREACLVSSVFAAP